MAAKSQIVVSPGLSFHTFKSFVMSSIDTIFFLPTNFLNADYIIPPEFWLTTKLLNEQTHFCVNISVFLHATRPQRRETSRGLYQLKCSSILF